MPFIRVSGLWGADFQAMISAELQRQEPPKTRPSNYVCRLIENTDIAPTTKDRFMRMNNTF
jgi:hypothetical protein